MEGDNKEQCLRKDRRIIPLTYQHASHTHARALGWTVFIWQSLVQGWTFLWLEVLYRHPERYRTGCVHSVSPTGAQSFIRRSIQEEGPFACFTGKQFPVLKRYAKRTKTVFGFNLEQQTYCAVSFGEQDDNSWLGKHGLPQKRFLGGKKGAKYEVKSVCFYRSLSCDNGLPPIGRLILFMPRARAGNPLATASNQGHAPNTMPFFPVCGMVNLMVFAFPHLVCNIMLLLYCLLRTLRYDGFFSFFCCFPFYCCEFVHCSLLLKVFKHLQTMFYVSVSVISLYFKANLLMS